MPETNNNAFIIAAYAVTWVTVVAYAVRLVLVSRRANAQLEQASQGAGGEA